MLSAQGPRHTVTITEKSSIRTVVIGDISINHFVKNFLFQLLNLVSVVYKKKRKKIAIQRFWQ